MGAKAQTHVSAAHASALQKLSPAVTVAGSHKISRRNAFNFIHVM